MQKPWEVPLAESTKNNVMSYIPETKGKKIFDFGAGYGRYLNFFAETFEKENIYSAEIDEESLQRIILQGYHCYKPNFHEPVLPFEDDFFDYIFSSNVVEHIKNKYYKQYLKEIRRVLKDKGTFIIGAPNYPYKRLFDIKKAFQTKNYKYYLLDDPTHINKLSILNYEEDLKEHFEEVNLFPTKILFEKWIKFFKMDTYKFRRFADKFFGYCK